MRFSGSLGQSGQVRKISPLIGFRIPNRPNHSEPIPTAPSREYWPKSRLILSHKATSYFSKEHQDITFFTIVRHWSRFPRTSCKHSHIINQGLHLSESANKQKYYFLYKIGVCAHDKARNVDVNTVLCQ